MVFNKTKRRRRLRECTFLRRFITKANRITDEDEMKALLFNLNFVSGISIQHGWTTWVEVTLEDGETFLEREFWAVDSLRKIANSIYTRARNKILTPQPPTHE